MRVHTNLKRNEMQSALKKSGAPIGFEVLDPHASKTHARAFEVRLTGSGYFGTGWAGEDFQGATWDEWGAFFGALYDWDKDARCGGSVKIPAYADADDFHYKTGNRFRARWENIDTFDARRTYLPADTHKRHHWDFVWADQSFACTKCSATRPPNVARAYA